MTRDDILNVMAEEAALVEDESHKDDKMYLKNTDLIKDVEFALVDKLIATLEKKGYTVNIEYSTAAIPDADWFNGVMYDLIVSNSEKQYSRSFSFNHSKDGKLFFIMEKMLYPELGQKTSIPAYGVDALVSDVDGYFNE